MKISEYLVRVGVPARYALSSFEVLEEGLESMKMEKAHRDRFLKIYDNCKTIVGDRKFGTYFWGLSGAGKTSLGVAMLRAYIKDHGLKPARTTIQEIVDYYYKDFKGVRERYLEADVLFIEEIGKEINHNSVNYSKIIEGIVKKRQDANLITMYSANDKADIMGATYGTTVFQIVKGTTIQFEFPKYDFNQGRVVEYVEKFK